MSGGSDMQSLKKPGGNGGNGGTFEQQYLFPGALVLEMAFALFLLVLGIAKIGNYGQNISRTAKMIIGVVLVMGAALILAADIEEYRTGVIQFS